MKAALSRLPHTISELVRFDSVVWRRALVAGVRRCSEPCLRHSPAVFGLAFAAALPDQRRRVIRNLRRVRGRRPAFEELRDITATFSTYAKCLTEALLLTSGRGYHVVNRVHGREHYEACASAGGGLLVVTAHTGGWDIAGPAIGGVHRGDVVLVMQRERDAQAAALQDAARERGGVKLVHVGDGALDGLPLLHHLRRGAVVAMQIDRLPQGMRSREVQFFGQPWRAPAGPLWLAALSGAPILPAFSRRLGFLEYETVLRPAIRLPRRPSPAELDAAAQQMTSAMESFVRKHPTQWFHFAD